MILSQSKRVTCHVNFVVLVAATFLIASSRITILVLVLFFGFFFLLFFFTFFVGFFAFISLVLFICFIYLLSLLLFFIFYALVFYSRDSIMRNYFWVGTFIFALIIGSIFRKILASIRLTMFGIKLLGIIMNVLTMFTGTC